ncbi:hypothetical protein MTO96_036688 [Rhipicephalus appendiculatus]
MSTFVSTCHCSDIKTSTTTSTEDTVSDSENRLWKRAYLEAVRRNRNDRLPRVLGQGFRGTQQLHSERRAPLFMSANVVNGVESDKRSSRQPAAASGDAGLSSDYVTARETITRQVSTQSKGQYWTPDESPGKSSQGGQDSFINPSVQTFTFYSLLAACFMTVLVYFYMVFNSSSSSPQAAHVALWSENDTNAGLRASETS